MFQGRARLAVAVALGLGGLALVPASAHATVTGSQNVSVTGVAYTCKATNAVIDQSVGGPQTFLINARTTVPQSVDGGDTIPSTPATLDLVLPELLMSRVRLLPTNGPTGHVENLGGSATSDVVIEGVGRDRKSTRLNSSHCPESRMPSSA